MKRLGILVFLLTLVAFAQHVVAADTKAISADATKTVWNAAGVKGKVCVNTNGHSVTYWFIKNGRNYGRNPLNGEKCMSVAPKVWQELRVKNEENTAITVQIWDDVTPDAVGSLIVSLEELGKAIGDGIDGIVSGVKDAFNIDVGKGQAGSGCYLIDGKPDTYRDDSFIRWIEWSTDQIIKPTSRHGENMQLHGMALRISEDLRWEFWSRDFGNYSRHSNWKSALYFTLAKTADDGHQIIHGSEFSIWLGKMHHGKHFPIEYSGEVKQLQSYDKAAAPGVQPYVCIETKRYTN